MLMMLCCVCKRYQTSSFPDIFKWIMDCVFQAFNILRYEIWQKYNAHYDSFNPSEYGPQRSQRVRSRYYQLFLCSLHVQIHRCIQSLGLDASISYRMSFPVVVLKCNLITILIVTVLKVDCVECMLLNSGSFLLVVLD